VDPTLTAVARQWAAQLAASGSLSHNAGLGAQAPAGWTAVGENVGFGQSIDEIDKGFHGDALHYANLVEPGFEAVGVGVVEAGGVLWAVEDFAGLGATGAAPPPVAARQYPSAVGPAADSDGSGSSDGDEPPASGDAGDYG
jgi:hypothetical protein